MAELRGGEAARHEPALADDERPQVAVAQIGEIEPRPLKVDPAQVDPGKATGAQIGPIELGCLQPGAVEIEPEEDGLACLQHRQRAARQIGGPPQIETGEIELLSVGSEALHP